MSSHSAHSGDIDNAYDDVVDDTQVEAEEDDEDVDEDPLNQLFSRLSEEIYNHKPANVIYFIVDFLCKFYPNHVKGLASVLSGDPSFESEKVSVVEFMKSQKIPGEIAGNFIDCGFDTLESLETITPETIATVEYESKSKWLTGHKVRLNQVFVDTSAKVKAFKDEKESAVKQYMQYQQPPPQQYGVPTYQSQAPQQYTTTTYQMMPPVPYQTPVFTQQPTVYPSGAFKTQFTPSQYVKPMQGK